MKINEVAGAAEDHWGDTTRRQPFLWKKALNDDDVFGYTKIICHADKLFLLIIDTIRYDTIEEINVDSKAEYTS